MVFFAGIPCFHIILENESVFFRVENDVDVEHQQVLVQKSLLPVPCRTAVFDHAGSSSHETGRVFCILCIRRKDPGYRLVHRNLADVDGGRVVEKNFDAGIVFQFCNNLKQNKKNFV